MSEHQTRNTIPGLIATLPQARSPCIFNLEYLNEGGANVIYKIDGVRLLEETLANLPSPSLELQDTRDVRTTLQGKVLRLRKETADAESVEQNVKDYRSLVEVIGGMDHDDEALLLMPTLVSIHDILKQTCSTHLTELSRVGLRNPHRSGGISWSENFATLLDDMSCGEAHVPLEFKLKWLAPSPSAPGNATCCRTCALTTMKIQTEGKVPKTSLCPLGHLVGDEPYRQRLVDESMSDNARKLVDYKQCEAWLCSLRSLRLIQKLRRAQISLDPQGSLTDDAYTASINFRIAMTLRDCSILAQIPKKTNGKLAPEEGVRFAIVDLDLKPDSQEKRDYWRSIERSLVSEGYYTTSAERLCEIGVRCWLPEYHEAMRNRKLD